MTVVHMDQPKAIACLFPADHGGISIEGKVCSL